MPSRATCNPTLPDRAVVAFDDKLTRLHLRSHISAIPALRMKGETVDEEVVEANGIEMLVAAHAPRRQHA